MYFCVQNGLRTEVIAVRSINCLSYTVEKEFVFCTVRTEPLNAHQEMFNFTPHVEGTDDGVLTWHSLLSGLCQLFNIPKMKELSAHRRLPLSVLRWKGVESSYPPETHRREHSPPPSPLHLSRREVILNRINVRIWFPKYVDFEEAFLNIFLLLFHTTVYLCTMLTI